MKPVKDRTFLFVDGYPEMDKMPWFKVLILDDHGKMSQETAEFIYDSFIEAYEEYIL